MYYFLFSISILFIALKLTGYIAWSWRLVLLPLYMVPVVFVIVVIFTMFILGKISPRFRK